MVNPKDNEELSAEELAKISGGYHGGKACPVVADDKLSKQPKIFDEGKSMRVSKNRKDGNNVSGDVVN